MRRRHARGVRPGRSSTHSLNAPHARGAYDATNKEGGFIKATEALVIVASTCVMHSEHRAYLPALVTNIQNSQFLHVMTQLCNDNRLYSNKEHAVARVACVLCVNLLLLLQGTHHSLEQCSSAHATELICA